MQRINATYKCNVYMQRIHDWVVCDNLNQTIVHILSTEVNMIQHTCTST